MQHIEVTSHGSLICLRLQIKIPVAAVELRRTGYELAALIYCGDQEAFSQYPSQLVAVGPEVDLRAPYALSIRAVRDDQVSAFGFIENRALERQPADRDVVVNP